MRLVMFYKIVNNEIDMELPSYIMEQRKATKSSRAISRNFIPLQPCLDCWVIPCQMDQFLKWSHMHHLRFA